MLEKIGYTLLILFLIGWIILVIIGLIEAMPEGLIGFLAIGGIGLLFIKVLKDRLSNEEDNYYDKNVQK